MRTNSKGRYNFDNYMIGPCNEEAYSLCKASVEDTAGRFVAIYGPSSCGKTHLLYAVKTEYQEMYPKRKVLMCTFEEFITSYLEYLRKDESSEFKKSLCGYDLIIIDNMQFAADKSTTQEELSYLFSEIIESGKSIVIAWDKPESCLETLLKGMKVRNSDRFFISEIKEPDVFLREKYLKMLMANTSFSISDEILDFIVNSDDIPLCAFNGLLSKLEVFQEHKGTQLTSQEMMDLLTDFTKNTVSIKL